MFLTASRATRNLSIVHPNNPCFSTQSKGNRMKTINGKTMLSTAEVSEYIGIPEDTIRYWRSIGEGPKSFRVGKRLVKYLQDDVDAWLLDEYERSVTA